MDRLERELEGQAKVLHLNVTGDVGRQLAARHSVTGVPTFVLFNREGEVVLKQFGMPDQEAIIQAVADIGGE